jgi:GNAT superfamily N-acetyltransferase
VKDFSADERARILTIEGLAARAWPAAESETYAGWVFRCIGGFTHRANSVFAVSFKPGHDVDDAIAAAEAFYRHRRQECCFMIPAFTEPPDLDRWLDERGYRAISPTDVMWHPDAKLDFDAIAPLDIRIDVDVTDDWIAVRAETLEANEIRLLRDLTGRVPQPRLFAVAYDGGTPVGAGMMVVEDDWAGLFALQAATSARRHGIGKAVFRTLVDGARAAGAQRLYLQVEQGNMPAQTLFRSLGFRLSHGYHYRTRAV